MSSVEEFCDEHCTTCGQPITASEINVCDSCQELRTYSIDELTGTTRQAALNTMREWQISDAWWESVYDDWKETKFSERAINCYCDSITFDLDRNAVSFSGRVDLDLLLKKPEFFSDCMHLKTAVECSLVTSPHLYIGHNARSIQIMYVESADGFSVDLSNTVFDGMDINAFIDIAVEQLDELREKVLHWLRGEVCAEILKDLEDEYSHLQSEESCVELAQNYKFNRNGEVV